MGAPASQQITTETDPWVRATTASLYNRANQYLENTPYQPYHGDTYAGAQPFQNAAAQYLSQGLLGQNLGFTTPTTYGPFSYDHSMTHVPNPDGGGGGVTPPGGYPPGGDGTNPGPDDGIGPGLPPDQQNPPYFTAPPEGLTGANQVMGSRDAVGGPIMPGGPSMPGKGGINQAMGVFPPVDIPPGGPAPNPNDPPAPPPEQPLWAGHIQPTGPVTPGQDGGIYTGGFGTMSGRQEGLDAAQGARGAIDYNSLTGADLIEDFQNPYEKQVIEQQQADMIRAEQMARAAGLHSMGSSAYGGNRGEIVADEANRNFYDRMGAHTARLRSQGFDTAASLAQQAANRDLSAANLNLMGSNALSRIGSQNLQNLFAGTNALMGMGNFGQQNAQNMINADIARYDQARNDPMRQFALRQQIIGGMPLNTTQSTAFTPNMASQLGGGLMGILGALGSGGAFTGMFGP